MTQRLTLTALALSVCAFSGCVWRQPALLRAQNPPAAEEQTENEPESNGDKTIYVVGHGWHTGLVLRRADIDRADWPESSHFFDAELLEVGWGDEGFYRAGRITPGLVARAAFVPTPSVLHIVGIGTRVDKYFPASDIVELRVSDEGFRELCRSIHRAYRLDESGDAEILGPGLYGESFFYRADESYYFPKTCNYWTAQALANAGVHIVPQVSMSAGSVMRQVRWQGTSLNRSSPLALIHALR